MKYSAIAQPEYGAMYCIGAASLAVADIMIVCDIESWFSRVFAICATVDFLWPMATYIHITFCFF